MGMGACSTLWLPAYVGMTVRDLLCVFVKRSGAEEYREKTAPLVYVWHAET